MNTSEERNYQNELLKDFCEQAVKDSELFDLLKNSDVDRKAEELFNHLRSKADDWLIEQEAALAIRVQREEVETLV
jgi:hypothetical protein